MSDSELQHTVEVTHAMHDELVLADMRRCLDAGIIRQSTYDLTVVSLARWHDECDICHPENAIEELQ